MYTRNTGVSGRSACQSVPRGIFSSSTMMVMRIAITPSLKASSRVRVMTSFLSGVIYDAGRRQVNSRMSACEQRAAPLCTARAALRLGHGLDVIQDAQMDGAYRQVRPDRPVGDRKERQRVPGAPLERGAAAGVGAKNELAAPAGDRCVQVIGEDAGIGAELAERGRLIGDVERQPARLVPGRDRLDERPGGEVAVADRTDAATVEAGAFGIGEPHAEPDLA